MTAVLVIGMHRSGTSLMTSLLGIAGAYLGASDEMLRPDQWNTAGYWEHAAFKDLNDRLLTHLGGSWLDPPALPDDWLEDPGVKALQSEASALIGEEFAPHPLYALKDPRASLVLPFWKSVVDKPRYVLCVRNPLAVAGSLLKRDEMPLEYGAALWHIYTLCSLMDTTKKDRLILLYDRILQDSVAASAPLFEFLDAGFLPSNPGIADALSQTVDPNLKHHEYALSDVLQHRQILAPTKSLYAALAEGDPRAIAKAIEDAPTTLSVLRAITRPCAELLTSRALLQSKLGASSAALQHKTDILNSRAHRVASAANSWLIKVKGRPKAK